MRAFVEKHFDFAVSTKLGIANEHSDLFALPRIDTYYLQGKLSKIAASPVLSTYLKMRSMPRFVRQKLFPDKL